MMLQITNSISSSSFHSKRSDRNRLLESLKSILRRQWELLRTNWQQQQCANIAMNESKAFCRLEETLRNTLGYAFRLQISEERKESTHHLQITLKYTVPVTAGQHWQIICALNQINERYGTLLRLTFNDNECTIEQTRAGD